MQKNNNNLFNELKKVNYKNLSLLAALDILLTEGSVAAAANHMNLSASAMSRILNQIRTLIGDPIFVRAGQNLVTTHKAELLRDDIHDVVERANSLLHSYKYFDVLQLDRVFTLRVTDSFFSRFGIPLVQLVTKLAPKVKLRFAPQGDENIADMRNGKIDLDIGVIGKSGPEIKVQTLFRDEFIGVARKEHPISMEELTVENFVKYKQISCSRRGRFYGPIDEKMKALGISRNVAVVVSGFYDAILLAQNSDLIALIPKILTNHIRKDMFEFNLPVKTNSILISHSWHPRSNEDEAQKWLRERVKQVCNG